MTSSSGSPSQLHDEGHQQQQPSHQRQVKHKRRYCRYPNCTRIVKSQGLCQRHGAKPRSCRVEGCTKQAQGNFDGMCKAHFKAFRTSTGAPSTTGNATIAPPTVVSSRTNVQGGHSTQALAETIFDRVLPSSIAYHCNGPLSEMPLVQHLRNGFDGGKPPAWHRNEERQVRGLPPALNANVIFTPWEIDMVWTETLLLTSNPDANFTHLAYAWGQEPGFHLTAVRALCRHRSPNLDRHRVQQSHASSYRASPTSNNSGGEDGGGGTTTDGNSGYTHHHHYQYPNGHHRSPYPPHPGLNHLHYQGGNPDSVLPRHNREMSVEMSLEFAASFLQQLQGDYGVNSFDEEDEHAPDNRRSGDV